VRALCCVLGTDVQVDVPEIGVVSVDIAYGGMWYAIVEAASVGLEIAAERGKDLVRIGEMIKVCLSWVNGVYISQCSRCGQERRKQ